MTGRRSSTTWRPAPTSTATRCRGLRAELHRDGNLIEECAGAGSVERFVFYSTQLVVGLFNETRFIDETEPYRTKTAYGESKIEGEQRWRAAARGRDPVHDHPADVGVRPVGRGPRTGSSSGRSSAAATSTSGAADNLVSWVYVKNLVDLTMLARSAPRPRTRRTSATTFIRTRCGRSSTRWPATTGSSSPPLPGALVTALAYALALPKRAGVECPALPLPPAEHQGQLLL